MLFFKLISPLMASIINSLVWLVVISHLRIQNILESENIIFHFILLLLFYV